MNPKNTWLWVALAASLFAFIFYFERHLKKSESGPPKVLPALNAQEIKSIQVSPKGQLAIYVQRTNQTWQLTEPLEYPAQANYIDALLATLENLTAASYLSAQDLKGIPDADEQFGFNSPQYSLMLDKKRFHLLIGRKTAFGDQVYVQVVGTEGIFIVDADLLKLIPQTADNWRTTTLVDWSRLNFDHLVVTNAGKILELQNGTTNHLWRMINPMKTRANNAKVRAALELLQTLRVRKFVSDEPKPDLESFGLQTPDLSLVFLHGTNTLLQLDFGKGPTNNADLAFARRGDQPTVVAVPKAAFDVWSFSHSHEFRDFLDPQLVVITDSPDILEIRAQDNFTLERQPDQTWRVMPENFLADSNLLAQVFTNLTNMQVTAAQIVKDVVPATALPNYGLESPCRQYILKAVQTDPASSVLTNIILAQLDFGANQDKLYSRVPGEGFVYSMEPGVLDQLPSASWQMRDRRIWKFTEEDVAGITIQQGAKTRQLLRKGDKNWALAPGSQGIIDEIVSAQVEESVHRLGDLTATFWVQRGNQNLDTFGFKETAYRITVELKTGEKLSVAFGKDAPSRFPYAAVELKGETWVLEFPWTIYQFVQMYLTIPANVP